MKLKNKNGRHTLKPTKAIDLKSELLTFRQPNLPDWGVTASFMLKASQTKRFMVSNSAFQHLFCAPNWQKQKVSWQRTKADHWILGLESWGTNYDYHKSWPYLYAQNTCMHIYELKQVQKIASAKTKQMLLLWNVG